MGNMSALERLQLTNCTALEELPASVAALRELSCVKLVGCVSLMRLPDFSALVKLKVITTRVLTLTLALP